MFKQYILMLFLALTVFINYSFAIEQNSDSVLDRIYQYENRVNKIERTWFFQSFKTDIAANTDLCEVVNDKIFADSDSGIDSITFTINNGDVVFRVRTFGSCLLIFSKRHSSGVPQGAGTRWWATYNDIIRISCDSIYVNENDQLICTQGSNERVVNLGVLHLLTQHKGCFRNSSYRPHYRDQVQDIASDLSHCIAPYYPSNNDNEERSLRELLEYHLIVRDR